MAALVSYESDDGSEYSAEIASKMTAQKHSVPSNLTQLDAEYESFEKMLAEDDAPSASATEPALWGGHEPSENIFQRSDSFRSESEEEEEEEEAGSSVGGSSGEEAHSEHHTDPDEQDNKVDGEAQSGSSDTEGSEESEESEHEHKPSKESGSAPVSSHHSTSHSSSHGSSHTSHGSSHHHHHSRHPPRHRRDSGHRRSRSRSKSRRSRSHRHRRRRSSGHRSRSRERKYSSSGRGSPHRGHRQHRSRSPRDRHSSRRGPHSGSSHHHRHHSPPPRRSAPESSRRSRDHEFRKDKKPKNFKEMMKQQILHASQGRVEDPVSITMPTHGAKNLVTMSGSGEKVTPQQALLQTMAAMHAKAQEMTGVALPKYYNPAAVNPLKYAEQMQKRKLLWSKNKEPEKPEEQEPSSSVGVGQWSGAAFQGDQTGEQATKFRKLMGIKADCEEAPEEVTEEQTRKQEELFNQLDREYAFARMATHTHRGVGLGFASQGLPDTQ